jgi:hypothetical protein
MREWLIVELFLFLFFICLTIEQIIYLINDYVPILVIVDLKISQQARIKFLDVGSNKYVLGLLGSSFIFVSVVVKRQYEIFIVLFLLWIELR